MNPNRTWTPKKKFDKNPNRTKPMSAKNMNRIRTQNFEFFPIFSHNLCYQSQTLLNLWHNFAFQKKKGVIDAESLREVLLQFNICLTNTELTELIRDCKETCLNGRESFFNSCSSCCQCRMIGLNKRQCIFHGNNNPGIPCECTDALNLAKQSAEFKSGDSSTSFYPKDQESSATHKKCSHELVSKYVPECNKPSDCCKICGRDYMNCTCDKEKMVKNELEDCCTPANDSVTYEVITFQEFLHFLTFFPYISKTKNVYGGERRMDVNL